MADLKLMALDGDGLTVLSAHCQDAVFKPANINWLAKEGRLLIELRRFVWEEAQESGWLKSLLGRATYQRRLSVLHFEQVQNVATMGIRPTADDVLSILAIQFEPAEDGVSGSIHIELSGGAIIRADVECVEARLADLGGAWETRNRPHHPG